MTPSTALAQQKLKRNHQKEKPDSAKKNRLGLTRRKKNCSEESKKKRGHIMPRYHLPSIRSEAKAAGLKTYVDPMRPCWCGCEARYVANAQCVDCLIAKGKARYAALTDDQLDAMKDRDRARYVARITAHKG